MNQDKTGNENTLAPEGASTANEETETKTTVETVTPPPVQTTSQSSDQPKTNNALKITTVICVVLALAGIGFGIYELIDANQKSSKISTLENTVSEKEAKIAELETTNSDLETEPKATSEINEQMGLDEETENTTESTATQSTGTVTSEVLTIEPTSIIEDTEQFTKYEIGGCTVDTGSLKCHTTTAGENSLIYYFDDGSNTLKMIIYKD